MKPDNVLALTNKGICLYELGKIQEAFKIFERAMKINPDVCPPWYYIGMYYLNIFQKSGELKAMEILVNCYRQVLRMVPDFGSYTIYDPTRDAQYDLDMFLKLHDDVQELPIEILTAL